MAAELFGGRTKLRAYLGMVLSGILAVRLAPNMHVRRMLMYPHLQS